MIGQEKLLSRLNVFTWETFPTAIILEGKFGCGKHTVCDILSQKFDVHLNDISSKITYDFILECYITPLRQLYVIDINKIMSSKRVDLIQNALLKFIEEPPNNARIIILCEHKNQLLPTIQNRCQIFKFVTYSVAELKQFAIVDLPDSLYDIYDTPGKVLAIPSSQSIEELMNLINNIIDNIYRASIPNILTIINKLDFGSGEGYDLHIFTSFMKYVLIHKLKDTATPIKYIKYYELTKKLTEQLTILNVNKQLLIEHYLLELKSVV